MCVVGQGRDSLASSLDNITTTDFEHNINDNSSLKNAGVMQLYSVIKDILNNMAYSAPQKGFAN
ncbi:MAG: hypothetical protein WAM26_09785 [Nitrososphaeraceae archaeon]